MYWYFIHIVFILCPSNYVIIAREVVVHTENFNARLRSRTIIEKVYRKKSVLFKINNTKNACWAHQQADYFYQVT